MKSVFLVLALGTSTAHAETRPTFLRRVEATMAPPIDTHDEAHCDGSGLIAMMSRVIGTARVTVLHTCSANAEASLAIRTGERWFVAPGAQVSFAGTQRRERIDFAAEHLGSGRLADGSAVALYTFETLSGGRDPLRYGHLQICAVDQGVACALVTFACDPAGCEAPRISRGVLLVNDLDEGMKRYDVMREPESVPQR